MPISAVAKISTDSGNTVSAGSDGGLYMPSGLLRGPAAGYVIDNSWSAAGTGTQYWYTSQASGFLLNQSITIYPNQAIVTPLAFARDCTIGTSVVRTAGGGTGTPTMYLAVYANNTVTGLPGAKIVDLLSWSLPVAATTVNSTQVTASPTFKANLLYWACMWTVGASTIGNIYGRIGQPAVVRATATSGTPFANTMTGSPEAAYIDATTASFTSGSGPASLTPITDTLSGSSQNNSSLNATHVWWGLTNV
jgi:hypothetical protein